MRKFFLFLAFLPLGFVSADDAGAWPSNHDSAIMKCRYQYPGDERSVVCWIAYSGENAGISTYPTNVIMTIDQCQELKDSLTVDYNNVKINFDSVKASLEILRNSILDLQFGLGSNQWLLASIKANIDTNTLSQAVIDRLYVLEDDIIREYFDCTAILGNFDQTTEQIDDTENILSNAMRRVQAIRCVDGQSCEGGSVSDGTCPCIDQFNQVCGLLNGIEAKLEQFRQDFLKQAADVQEIKVNSSNAVEYLQFMWDRALKPDDRLWSDLESLITNMVYSSSRNIQNIEKRRLDLSLMLSNIQRWVRGDLSSEDNIKLSNEGVIALYSLVGDFMNYSLLVNSNVMTTNFIKKVQPFFDLFQTTASNLNGIGAKNNLMAALYRDSSSGVLSKVATNTSYHTPYARYVDLIKGNPALTNWFSRMEFYQQVALGWFESPESALTDAQPTSQSTVEDTINNATNSFGYASQDLNSLTNNVGLIITPMVQSLEHLSFNPSLPQMVQVFPPFTIAGYVLDPQFSTEHISGICETVRSVSSMIWGASFWVLMVGLSALLVWNVGKAVLWFIKYASNL